MALATLETENVSCVEDYGARDPAYADPIGVADLPDVEEVAQRVLIRRVS